MDRAKKARTPHRTTVSRICNEIETELSKAQVDAEALDVLKERLLQEQRALQNMDSKVMDALLDTDPDDEIVQSEHDNALYYQDKIRLFLRKILKLCHIENNGNSSDSTSICHTKKYKLPKIELQKFAGDLKMWLGWWSQFQRIHDDEALHTSDKFHYLIQATEVGSEAREIVSSYPPTPENYTEAVAALKERYGRENLQWQFYIRELLSLVITNATTPDKLPIQTLFIKLHSYIRSLKSLNLANENPSTYFYPLVESCLSEELLRAWRRSTPQRVGETASSNSGESNLDNLMKFLKTEVRNEQQISLARTGFGASKVSTNDEKSRLNKRKWNETKNSLHGSIPTAAGLMTGKVSGCVFCGKAHASHDCNSADKMGMDERREKVKDKKLCFTCLKPGHRSKGCKTFVKCQLCSKRHYKIMCNENGSKENVSDPPSSTNSNVSCRQDVLLKTLVVWANGPEGRIKVRLVSDEGSQSSHVGKAVVQRTGSPIVGSSWSRNVLFGGKLTQPVLENLRRVKIESLDGQVQREWVLRERSVICPGIPRIPEGPWLQKLLQGNVYPLDMNTTSVDLPEVEILIGQDLLNEMVTNQRILLTERLAAVKTIFGWCICGPLHHENEGESFLNLLHTRPSVQDLWSLEVLGVRDPIAVLSEEESDAQARAHFRQNVRRHESGRYIVRLPWVVENAPLWKNNGVAKQRLMTITKRLKANGKFGEYDSIIKQWLNDGLIEKSTSKEFHLMPHRPVYKPSSLTTPVRPVFNASFKVAGCVSLNDSLHKGPNLLEKIPHLVNKFREKNIGVVADIKRAFQTIEVDEIDRNAQSFVWWENEDEKIMQVYRHCRVVFGVNASPFLLAAVLDHHFDSYPTSNEIVKTLKSSFYVDNLVTSLDNLDEYEKFKIAATEVLEDAKMQLTQWQHTKTQHDDTVNTKVLGLVWDTGNDCLSVDIDRILVPEKLTKRATLSILHRIFDPIGLLSPALLPMKLMLQRTWKTKLGWDDEVPMELRADVVHWLEQLKVLSQIRIPRKMLIGNKCDIHIFTDASKEAFAAAVYVRSFNGKDAEVQLVQAKSRVAPLKPASIPRLELMGCLLGARLAASVRKSLNIENENCYYWSDSTTAITWINKQNNLNVFVRNRVTEIRSLTGDCWRYVPTSMNLADLPSRGCSPGRLLDLQWWKGADWIVTEDKWPAQTFEVDEAEVSVEIARQEIAMTHKTKKGWFATKFSKFSSNVKVMGYVMRFINNCKGNPKQNDLSEAELSKAEISVVGLIQKECFDDEFFKRLKIRTFIDDGIIKVVTKLTDDVQQFRSPILLPSNHDLVDKLISEIHLMSGHAGTQVIMSRIREKYWILRSRKTIRRVISKCTICRRHSTKAAVAPPAPLPNFRTRMSDVFESTGVDLAGPLVLLSGEKAWVVLYTCAVFRAVHLDLISSLSAFDFCSSLQRFVCQFGRPTTISSDQGTNLIATKGLVEKLDYDLKAETSIPKIKWVLNPPAAPWWGGWWERLIKTVKEQLKRMLGKSRVNSDQLRTCLSVVAATINDRPLTVVSEDANDLVPLTPSMFLHPIRYTRLMEDMKDGALPTRYRNMQSLTRSLRERFRKEYLALLVQHKSEKPTNLKPGDVVMVGTDNRKRIEWPLGLVIALIAGRDGVCRVAKVKTVNGVLTRPIQRLFPLEIHGESNFDNRNTGYVTRFGREVVKPLRFTTE